MSKTKKFDAAAWVAANPDAAPSQGQVFALIMPSKGGLNTGGLRATEAAEKLESLGLTCWTREGLAKMNDAIRASKQRREAGQAWLTGLLGKSAPIKGVEVPEEAEEAPTVVEDAVGEALLAALEAAQGKAERLEAEIKRLREGVEGPEEVPAGLTFVRGHLRRKR